MRMIIWVLWPAFSAAVIAEAVFFILIDPQQLYLLGEPVTMPVIATYSIGFLLFWLLCTGACLMSYMMLPVVVKDALRRHMDTHPLR